MKYLLKAGCCIILTSFCVMLVQSQITVASPNGGENWTAGTTHAVTWTSSGADTTKFEFTTSPTIVGTRKVAPEVVSHTPSKNALNVAKSTNISAAFDLPINTSTLTASNILVYGLQSGKHAGTITISGDTMFTFDPATDFRAGEVVTVNLTKNILSALGDSLTNGHHWSFTIEASPSTGAFARKVDYGAGTNYRSVFVSDLDGDGDGDIVAGNYNYTTVSVIKNNGNGTFASNVDYTTGPDPASVYVYDVDNDGDGDIITANYGGSGSGTTVSVLKNNGNGTFASKVDYAAGNGPWSVFVSDLDGDGDGDIAVANAGSNNVSVLKNYGNGTFAYRVNYATGSWPYQIFVSDIDNDGDGDLVCTNEGSRTVSILKNNGDATFASKTDSTTGSVPHGLFVGDVDGDGYADLAVGKSDSISIFKNNGDGTFASYVNYPTGSGTGESIVMGDIDGDGDGDIAVACNSLDVVAILKNHGNGTFATKIDYSSGDGPVSVAISDINNDGDGDLVVANFISSTVSVLKNLTYGSIRGRVFHDINGHGDWNGDDTAVVGWKIFLKNPSEIAIDSQLTNSDGEYRFDNLQKGTYIIAEKQDTAWIQTFPSGLGTYTISLLDSLSDLPWYDFGNTIGYRYIGHSAGNWSDSTKWTGGHPPGPTNAAIIPTGATVSIDSLPSDTIQALRITGGGTLIFGSNIGSLKVFQSVQIDSGGVLTLPISSDTTGIICYKDWVYRGGTFEPGHSTITFSGHKSQTIASERGSSTFYNLKILGDSTSVVGNFTVKNQLVIPKGIVTREQDSIVIQNSDTSAIADTGIISNGTIVREIKPRETGTYRFESPGTYIKFTEGGTNPSSVSMKVLPGSGAEYFYWDSLGGRVDNSKKRIVIGPIRSIFSRFPIATPRPRVVHSRADSLYCRIESINRMYSITPENGSNYSAEVSLRYTASDLAGFSVAKRGLSSVSSSETDLKLFRGPYFADSVQSQWNMISLPLIPDSATKISLFPTSISDAFAYIGTYEVRTTLDFGIGYWLKFPNAQQVIIQGDDRDSFADSVVEGWNLIGSISYPIVATSVTSIPANIIISDFFGYTASYQKADTLYPLQSYWVKTSSAGKLILTVSKGGSFAKSHSPELDQLNILTVCDAGKGEQQLYFGESNRIDVNRHVLPPIPPVGVFDARYSTGRRVELAEKETKEYPILISTTEYPITIRWDMKDAAQSASLIIDGRVITLSQSGATEIKNPNSEIKLRLGSASSLEIPKEFALEQNYPNPFNPTTTIHYQLPVDCKVILKIYNILGQEVQTLVDEMQNAGYKAVAWNAGDLSSGVYFYRLTTNTNGKSFVAVKKLLLMK